MVIVVASSYSRQFWYLCTRPFTNPCVVTKQMNPLAWARVQPKGYKWTEQKLSSKTCCQETICCCEMNSLMVCNILDIRECFKVSEGNPEHGKISKMRCSLTSKCLLSAPETLMLKKAWVKQDRCSMGWWHSCCFCLLECEKSWIIFCLLWLFMCMGGNKQLLELSG